jgi:hypothetical protein
MVNFYKTQRPFNPGENLPRVSTDLDSVRAYQFEVRFGGLPQGFAGQTDNLTLAAKQVSPVNINMEPITVERVNDKLYYPGKATMEAVTVTFDNLYLAQTSPALWNWFKTIYDPITGDMTQFSPPGGLGVGSFKANKMTIVELSNTQEPINNLELYGVYPMTVRFSEKNYSTNEFSTVEVTFRYDYVDYYRRG